MRFLRFNVQGNIQTCPESARPVKMEADTHQQQNLTENGFADSMLEMESDSPKDPPLLPLPDSSKAKVSASWL